MDDHAFYHDPSLRPLPRAIGRYRVRRLLSDAPGRWTSIYLAYDEETGTDVAVKAFRDAFDSFGASVMATILGPQEEEVVRQEGRLLSRLRDPHVVRLLDSGEDPALGPYLVLEWLPGGDLQTRLDAVAERRLPVEEAIGIGLGTLGGLAAVHAMDVVHHDISPGNILLDAGGHAKLADFGVAAESMMGRELPGRGTPGYMAPEQEDPGRTLEVGLSADLYATGVVLFEMLAGRPPNGTEDVQALRPQTPDSVALAVMRALHDQPARRFNSAQAMARALAGH